MKKIGAEEAAGMLLKEGKQSLVRATVQAMAVGEFLVIEKKDWHQQNGPAQMVRRLEVRTGQVFKVKGLYSGEGWLVERVK